MSSRAIPPPWETLSAADAAAAAARLSARASRTAGHNSGHEHQKQQQQQQQHHRYNKRAATDCARSQQTVPWPPRPPAMRLCSGVPALDQLLAASDGAAHLFSSQHSLADFVTLADGGGGAADTSIAAPNSNNNNNTNNSDGGAVHELRRHPLGVYVNTGVSGNSNNHGSGGGNSSRGSRGSSSARGFRRPPLCGLRLERRQLVEVLHAPSALPRRAVSELLATLGSRFVSLMRAAAAQQQYRQQQQQGEEVVRVGEKNRRKEETHDAGDTVPNVTTAIRGKVFVCLTRPSERPLHTTAAPAHRGVWGNFCETVGDGAGSSSSSSSSGHDGSNESLQATHANNGNDVVFVDIGCPNDLLCFLSAFIDRFIRPPRASGRRVNKEERKQQNSKRTGETAQEGERCRASKRQRREAECTYAAEDTARVEKEKEMEKEKENNIAFRPPHAEKSARQNSGAREHSPAAARRRRSSSPHAPPCGGHSCRSYHLILIDSLADVFQHPALCAVPHKEIAKFLRAAHLTDPSTDPPLAATTSIATVPRSSASVAEVRIGEKDKGEEGNDDSTTSTRTAQAAHPHRSGNSNNTNNSDGTNSHQGVARDTPFWYSSISLPWFVSELNRLFRTILGTQHYSQDNGNRHHPCVCPHCEECAACAVCTADSGCGGRKGDVGIKHFSSQGSVPAQGCCCCCHCDSHSCQVFTNIIVANESLYFNYNSLFAPLDGAGRGSGNGGGNSSSGNHHWPHSPASYNPFHNSNKSSSSSGQPYSHPTAAARGVTCHGGEIWNNSASERNRFTLHNNNNNNNNNSNRGNGEECTYWGAASAAGGGFKAHYGGVADVQLYLEPMDLTGLGTAVSPVGTALRNATVSATEYGTIRNANHHNSNHNTNGMNSMNNTAAAAAATGDVEESHLLSIFEKSRRIFECATADTSVTETADSNFETADAFTSSAGAGQDGRGRQRIGEKYRRRTLCRGTLLRGNFYSAQEKEEQVQTTSSWGDVESVAFPNCAHFYL